MIGAIMAGGRGTRMRRYNEKEKLLISWRGRPLVLHVADALLESGSLSSVLAATSPNAPGTEDILSKHRIDIIRTSGAGYSEDLGELLESFRDTVLIVPGDMPLLDSDIINRIASVYDGTAAVTSIVISRRFLDSAGIECTYTKTVDDITCCYSGISMIDASGINRGTKSDESCVIMDDIRIAVNINRGQDLKLSDVL